MMGDEKNKQKNHIAGIMFFLSPEINLFFFKCYISEIGNNPMRVLGRKKYVFLVMRCLNLIRALI